MSPDEIDRAIECVAFLTTVLGEPDGHVREPQSDQRRWLWGPEDEPAVVHLVLEKDNLRVELTEDADELHNPRYLSIIGWCAMHQMPCCIFCDEGPSRIVTTYDVPDGPPATVN